MLLQRATLLLAFSLVSLLANSSVLAQANFDNGMPVKLISGYPADIGSDDNFPLHIADDFVLPVSDPTISRVLWFGTQGNKLGDPIPNREFNIEIYGPGVLPMFPHPVPLYTFHNINPTKRTFGKGRFTRTIGPFVINRYSYRLPSTITLTPGQTYWISIYAANDPSVSTANYFYWCHSSYVGGNTLMRSPPFLTYFAPTVSFYPYTQGDVSFKLFP